MENISQNKSISQAFSPPESERSSGSPASVESVLRRTSNSGLKHTHRQIDGLKKIRRMAANARERCRMHTVNYAFDKLRMLVPCYPSDRKLSKIATLKLATMYIADLAALLRDTNQSSLLPSDDIKLDCMLPQPPRRYNIHTDHFDPSFAIKSESYNRVLMSELELDSISNLGEKSLQNIDCIEMSKMVPSNIDFSDPMPTPGWMYKQNEMMSPNSDKYDQILCNQVSYEYTLPTHIQTK